jgi:pimeloyl-ACP methyl ester carboxylesterase
MKVIGKTWVQLVLATGLVLQAVAALPAHAKAPQGKSARQPEAQIISLDSPRGSYNFAVYSGADLHLANTGIRRAVIFQHGIKRDADRYFDVGLKLLEAAHLDPSESLLLAPAFLTASDKPADDKIPLWRGDNWMQCQVSVSGPAAVNSCEALDGIAQYLTASNRFPALKEIIFIGHSAGAQLLQRYAVLNNAEDALRKAGIRVRYVISSPSSYLYLDANRPEGDSFAAVNSILCPGYNNYRYGPDNMVEYGQGLDGEQLFRRYAARDVTYLVGARDNNPSHRLLDKSCSAVLQGTDRVDRHKNYLRYEQFLARKWRVPVKREEMQVPGAGHEAAGIFESEAVAEKIFRSTGK